MASTTPLWSTWDEVPRDCKEVLAHGPFFLEIFSGTARLTEHVAALGIPVLPPIDIETSEWVPRPVDILDAALWDRVVTLAHHGAIFFVHLGTPCNTFSAARKLDGGPPRLRSEASPLGLADLSFENRNLVTLGNMSLDRSVEIAEVVLSAGGNFSIESPLKSLLWSTPAMLALSQLARALDLDFDQCAFGAPSVKPTRLKVSSAALSDVCKTCPGNHVHERLTGKVWDHKRGRYVFRTKLAQECPYLLCATMALGIHQLWIDDLAHLSLSFRLCTPAADRKRPLGLASRWKEHRQAVSAQKALESGNEAPSSHCSRSKWSPAKQFSGLSKWYTPSPSRSLWRSRSWMLLQRSPTLPVTRSLGGFKRWRSGNTKLIVCFLTQFVVLLLCLTVTFAVSCSVARRAKPLRSARCAILPCMKPWLQLVDPLTNTSLRTSFVVSPL